MQQLGCSKNLTLGTLETHEFMDCPNRIIRCPAKTCNYKATPAQINEQVLSCVYMKYVCNTYRTAFSFAITDHDCTVLLRRHLHEYEFGAKPKLEKAICTASHNTNIFSKLIMECTKMKLKNDQDTFTLMLVIMYDYLNSKLITHLISLFHHRL